MTGNSPSQRTAIVVDDDDLVLAATSALLEDLGFKAVAEASAQQALTRMRSNEGFDLLLTDLRMPGMTGDQLINEVLRDRPHISVILASGYEFERGAIGDRVVVLRKPYGKADLIRAIGESMQRAMAKHTSEPGSDVSLQGNP